MNKSKYGRLSIIIILIATLFISAAIAIFGLSTNKGTGANSSAEISAPEKDASTALLTGEENDDGTISAPEVEAKATATTALTISSGTWYSSTLTGVYNSNGATDVVANVTGDVTFSGVFTVPSGKALRIVVNGGKKVTFTSGTYFDVYGTLYAYKTGTGSGSIQGGGSSESRGYSAFRVQSGGWFYPCDSNGQNGIHIQNFTRGGYGGAIYVLNGGHVLSGNGTMISGCTGTYGGAAYVASGGELTWSTPNSISIASCSASSYGGAIYNAGTLNIQSAPNGGIPYGNIIQCTSTNGAAIYNTGTFNFSSGRINVISGTGSAVHNAAGGTFNLQGGQIGYDNYSISKSGNGAAVYNAGTFKMTSGNITNCKSTSGNGGGVYNTGTFNMSGGTITKCSGEYGAAVCSSGSGKVTISGTATITDNEARTHGGGVYAIGNGCTFEMKGGTISDNTADNAGGGVYYEGGTVTLSSGSITGNTAAKEGGGFLMHNKNKTTANLTISGTSINDNTAGTNGGGVYLNEGVTASYTGGSMYDNSAASGGGIYVDSGGSNSLTVDGTNVELYRNTATNNGGGIFISGTSTTVTLGTVAIYENEATRGGGLYVSNTTVSMASGTKIGRNRGYVPAANKATYGAGVYVGSGTFNMSTGYVTNNAASASNNAGGNGGGVYVAGGTFNFTKGDLTGNSAVNGGGVYYSGGTFTINGGTISNNTATNGGGVYLNTSWTPTKGTISNNTATGNSSTSGGGGVCVGAGTFTLNTTNVNITNNSASSSYGGGVSVAGGTFTLSGGAIRSNSAYYGGGVSVLGTGNFTFSSGTIGGINGTTQYTNTATEHGGGLFISSTGTVTLSGGSISYNKAKNGGGIHVYNYDKTLTLSTSVNNNTATVSGGGVFLRAGVVTQGNIYIRNNTANSYGGGVYVAGGTFNINNGYIGGSTSYANEATYGGGVYQNGGTVNLNVGGRVNYNKATSTVAANSSYGGGVYLASGTFNLLDGEITGNQATNSASTTVATYGGGVYVAGGTFNLSNGNIRSNSARQDGGGIYAAGSSTIKITGGTIGGSTSYANTAKVGGGLYINTSTAVTFSGGTISYNTAASGAGISMYQGSRTLNMSGSAIISYNASTGAGGGIYVNGTQTDTTKTTVNLSGGQIYCNSAATYGGGIFATGANAVLNMTGGTIGGLFATSANTAGNNGGGICNASGTATISAGTIANNTATVDGGGISSSGSLEIKGTALISNNSATGSGGGIYSTGTITMSAGTISGNTAKYAAGLYSSGSGTSKLSGTAVITNNEASSSGGGLSVYGGTFDIDGANVEIKENTANVITAGYGGGIYVYGGTLNLKQGKIHSNEATYGGGVFVNGGKFNITGGTIGGEGTGNTALRNSGGVMVNPNGEVEMSGGTISYNEAKNDDPSGANSWGWGGGVGGAGTFTMTDGTISHNTAKNCGGGVGLYSSGIANLRGGEISENTALFGGGVAANQQATINLAGVTITGNTATQSGGGAYVMGSTATINMSAGEISENTANLYAGGVYVQGGKLSLTGGKITANSAMHPEGVGVHVKAGSTLELGGKAYVYNNTYREEQNNAFIEDEQSVTFSGTLADGAKLGIIAIEDFVLTDGFTTAGHTEADIAKYFSSDIHGLTLKYENSEIVVTYDIELAWNETVQASLDKNGATELFVLYKDWTAVNGSFGDSAGVGFYGVGTILVPDQASILFDFNGKTVDGAGTAATIMRVEGEIVLDTYSTGIMTGGNAENGGAIYVNGGYLTLKNGTISENIASYGGAIYVDGSGEFSMEGGSIVLNTAENGGAVYVKDGTVSLTDGRIGGTEENGNSATSYGGAVYVAGGGLLTIDGTSIGYNEALSGGAVYVAGGRFDMNSGNIFNNEATENGGGVYVDSGIAAFAEGFVMVNTAENGGGVYVAGGNVTIDGNGVMRNSAVNGGGMYVAGGNVLMSDGRIAQNTAVNGGGVYVTGNSAQFTLSGGQIGGSIFTYTNTAEYGVGIYINGGTVTVTGEGEVSYNTNYLAKFLENKDIPVNGAGVYLANGTLNVTGGTITENEAENGGGVYVAGGDFNLFGGEISGNRAENGAGVYMTGGTFTISADGVLNENEADVRGGGVYVVSGTLNMSGGEISENTVEGDGAGVYLENGTFSLSGGSISENVANDSGGGVYVELCTLNISGGEISSNEAIFGAGVYVASGTVTMTDGVISDNIANAGGGGVDLAGDEATFTISGTAKISGNTASSGGGVYNYGTFTMNGGEISENTVDSLGGGIVIFDGGSLVMNDGEISGNTAVSGGGVYVNGTFTLNDGKISGNKAQQGAGVYVDTEAAQLLGGEISGNVATGATTTYGGGVYLNTNAELIMSEPTVISGNSAILGGGVYVKDGAFCFEGGEIRENSASSGGGLYIMSGATEMTGGTITQNSSTSASVGYGGGGVFVNCGALVVSGNAKIIKNSAARYGGGIRIDGSTDTSTVEMTAGSVSENTATIGGGVYVAGNFASLTLETAAMVSKNTATTSGGGVAVADGASLKVAGNAYITENEASLNGGGVFVTGTGSTATISDHGAITYNTANYGGGVYVTASGKLVMENGALSHNTATANGGAVYVTGATFTLEDGEIFGNSATTNGGAVYVAAGASSIFNMNGGAIGGKDIDKDGNNVAANVAKLGGGVYMAGGNVTLTSGKISYNEATENGGGVYFNAGTLSVKGNPVIKENTFQKSASNLYLYNGKTVTVIGELTEGAYISVTATGQVTVGYTANGNGEDEKVYFAGDVAGAIVVINVGEIFLQISLEDAWNAAVQASLDKGGSAVTFILAENWSAKDGEFGASTGVGFTDTGALYLPQGAYVIINLNGNSINRNMGTATEEGSVFYVEGKLEISGTTGYIIGGASENGGAITIKDGGYVKLTIGYIQNNSATENGGGVYVASGANFEMAGGYIRGNSAKNGGAVYVENGGTFTLTAGTIGGTGFANSATENGGAIYNAGSFTMAGGTLTLNAAEKYGAGVYSEGTFNMTGGTITNHGDTMKYGAGVYVAGGEATLSGGKISDNEANKGAALYVTDGEVTIDGTTLSDNDTNMFGGAVYVGGGTVNFVSGKITNNHCGSHGGAVCVEESGKFIMSGGEISNNTCGYEGGAVYVRSYGMFEMSDGTINGNSAKSGGAVYMSGGTFNLSGGRITNNSATDYDGGGVKFTKYHDLSDYISNGTTTDVLPKFTMTGGVISGNSTVKDGGGVDGNGIFTMSGGEISNNNAVKNGAGVCLYAVDSVFTMNGGKITGNGYYNSGVAQPANGGGVYFAGTFIMNDGEISNNKATVGAGVYANGKLEMNGGNICDNSAAGSAGGVSVTDNKTFTMKGGSIFGNSARVGGGILVLGTATMNGGEVTDNYASMYGGGVLINNDGTFVMTDGEISSNTASSGAGVYVEGTMTLTGGTITANEASALGGGVYVTADATFEMEGSPMVYGNTAAGEENNVYLVANQTIVITGMLSIQGLIAYVGVTMADPSKRKFTSGFAANNTDYNPDLRPETVFFSDNTDYMVSLEDGEAVLSENDYSQTSLVWQLSKDGGTTWISIDAPLFSLRYKAGETYSVRALDSTGTPVDFTWATGADGDIDATNFSGKGSYKFVINSDDYINPSLTVEILPAQLIWQYSTDEGRTWFDFTSDTVVYTGATYQVRAVVYYDPEPVQVFTDEMKDVGSYQYTVDDDDLYENPTLNFTITTRYITVDWNFGDALGNATDGYYWEYDGKIHTPIAVLNGVSNELVGVTLNYAYDWSGGLGSSDAMSYAGTYTLTVTFKTADPNVVISGNTVTYKINGVTLTLEWVDENGNTGDEFEFEYDSEPHGVDFILNGVITGDNVGAYVTYETRTGKVLSGAPTAVGYYTATVKLPADCYNYTLDRTYTCQIVITQKTIAVQWTPNTDGTFEWTFNGLGKGPVATIINPYTGEALNEAYTIEYALVASNGSIGQPTLKQPVNAGKYIVRVTLNSADANYVLDEESATQEFIIKKLDVEITWSGADGYDADKDVYYWYYDGNEHDIEAKISLVGLAVNKDGVIIDSLGIERTDVRTKLVTVGSATATVVLLNEAFNANFNITNSTSQVYEVRKAVIDAVTWTDKLNQKFDSDDTPEYDFGSISGATGPAFVATAIDGAVTLVVTYDRTYTGDWVVDETVGYVAYARLSAADAANYELADGAEYFSIKFFVNSVGGFKTPISVTWVVFINDYDYVSVAQYLSDGGFVYNGNVQYPTPIYIKDNGIDYEKLELQPNSIGADAGKYTARIKPSSVYSIDEDDFTYDYEIKKLDIIISWQDGQNDSDTTFSYVYSGIEQKPYAYVDGTYDFTIEVTVNGGKVNAGKYLATATVSKNFNITSGKTQSYTINKKGLQGGLVEWDWNNASGDATNGYYWIYNGQDHAPTAVIPAQNWGGDYDLVLVVTGNTSEIGTHTAYAVLSSSVPAHNNFQLTDTVSVSFEIKQVQAGKVYWEDPADPDTAYEDGSADATKLVFTYNGDTDGQKPKAFYYDEDGNKVYLTVTVIGGTAVEAGTYTAYVSSDLDFESELPTCTFKINPMEITVQWDGTTTLTFNGEEQHPAVTLSNGADNYVLVEGVDYEVTGYTKAGKYTAEIKFLNSNYTCADADKTFDFVIEKIELSEIDGVNTTEGFTWAFKDAAGTNLTATVGDDGKIYYEWTYGAGYEPDLTITYTIDGVNVVFDIGYYGATSAVGTHTVTAYVKSATLNGADITENFNLEAEMEYVIKSVSVTIEWDWTGAQQGTDENGDSYYFWTYDTDKHAPKAYLLDANGDRIQKEDGSDLELTVYGGESNARDAAYTATAVVPSEYNYTGDTTATYFVKKATIAVNWVFTDETGAVLTAKTDDGGNTYYEWTYGTTVTAKAYIKNDDGTNGAELTNVTGFETDAGTHTLTVSQSDGNYEFASQDDATQVFVINPQKVYVLWYGADGIDNNDTTNFEWTYGGENTVPTAYLAYKDSNGDLQLILDENGKAIQVEVSGASNDIGTHVAQVVDTFVNYEFATGAALTQPFKINEKDATGFEWKAEGATVTGNATDGYTYTYEYSGANNLPVATSSVEDLEFNTTIVKVNADSTTETVLSITEVGTYKVTVTSRDGNYKVPDALKEITVVVTAKTVKVEWDESKLVYNGKNQMPKAYYTDVTGNKIELDVSVTGDTADAGTTYTATATLTSTNYKLDTATETFDFEITAKTISVTWGDNEFDYDDTAHATLPKIVLTSDEKDGITKIVYEIKDKDGNVVAGTNETDKKVIKAGEYTIKVWLEGPAAGNYQLDKDEYTFNINKAILTITAADDKEIDYSESLTLTLDDVKIEGLIAAEANDVKAYLESVLDQWLICHYTNTSLPDDYTIYVDASWLNDNLDNYIVTGINGKLTVNPAEGKLIWKADKYDENGVPVFTYDGEAKLPQAFYYDAQGNKVSLTVKYAEYDAATDTYTVVSDPDYAAKNVDDYYAVIVDANGNVINEHGSYTFENFGVKFAVEKREIVITVNVDSFAEWKYGDVSSTNVAQLLGLGNGYFIGDTKPLEGDDLGIKLEIVESFENGFLNAGDYTVVIKWNEAGFGSNYTMTVVVGDDKLTEVENETEILTTTLSEAEIKVDLDKDGDYYVSDYIIMTNGQSKCDFLDDPESFIQIAGYQDARVTIRFSAAFEKGTEPSIENTTFTNSKPVITEVGEYVINFRITVDNHKTFVGQLYVKAVDKENVLFVSVIKDVETPYGFEVTDTLAQWLFENGYAAYDADINPADITEKVFLEWVTAKVVDEDGNEVTGKLAVGNYKVILGLNDSAPSKYGIHVNDSKHVNIEITKYVIDIDWGDEDNLNYTYDGETHMPVIKVEGTVLDDSNKVADGVYEITVNGEKVKVYVTVDGDFKTAGAHSVLVTVDDGNYAVEEENALRSVSITEPAKEVPVPAEGNGVADWQLWLIIAAAIVLAGIIIAIVVALVKRRKMGDDDGFYDPVDESDL